MQKFTTKLSSYNIILGLLCLSLLLTGCAIKKGPCGTQLSRYQQKCDSAPIKPPKDIKKIPDAVPIIEPKSKYGNPPSYVVFNKKYRVLASSDGYKEKGLASWYGTKFHGYRTSSGELYDMYKMTAAHKTLPLPTYVQVKNLANGKKVIVKINDRGPFHSNRILDLSYAAAVKLDILRTGTAKIEVTAIPQSLIAKNSINNPSNLKNPVVPQRPRTATITQIQRNHPTIKTLAMNTMPKTSISRASNLKNISTKTPASTTNNVAGIVPTYRYLQVGAFNKKENAETLRRKILQITSAKMQVNIQISSTNKMPIFRVRVGPIDNPNILNQVKNKIIQAKLPIPMAMP